MNDATGGLAPQQSALPQPGTATRLVGGCYLINYTPFARSLSLAFSGTLRIETTAERMLASGDLYRRPFDDNADAMPPLPDPKAGIPIFPIGEYRYYLRVIDIHPTDVGVDLSFDLVRYSKDKVTLLDESETHWLVEDSLTVRMGPPPPIDDPTNDGNDFPRPEAFPSPQLVFAGPLVTSAGETIGILSMGFVSSLLRKATLELNSVAKSHVPRDNAAGETFASIFRKVGWDLTVMTGDTKVGEPGGKSWSAREADAQMGARRQLVNFDKEWHYDLLAVRKIDPVAGEMDPEDTAEDNGVRGYMYDRFDPTVRQGLMVASRYVIPDTPKWGELRGMALGATTAYFRTALHEFGHALGLSHNESDNGFMNPTDTVAASGTENHPFPENVLWSYAPDDQNRLRHGPDLVVRPQGPDVGDPNVPTGLFFLDGLKLEAGPIQPSVPLGMPVRVRLLLRNMTKGPLSAPASLGLKAGNVRGRVIDASGTTRAFIPSLVYGSRGLTEDIDPAQAREGSLTLFAGPDGDLFPTPGVYRIMVDARWRGVPMKGALESDVGVSAETTVTVTPT